MFMVGFCVWVECLDLEFCFIWFIDDSVVICQGEAYDFYGILFIELGLYIEFFIVSNGCDSFIMFDLSVLFVVFESF